MIDHETGSSHVDIVHPAQCPYGRRNSVHRHFMFNQCKVPVTTAPPGIVSYKDTEIDSPLCKFHCRWVKGELSVYLVDPIEVEKTFKRERLFHQDDFSSALVNDHLETAQPSVGILGMDFDFLFSGDKLRQGFGFDQEGFDMAMAKQREQARKHWQGSGATEIKGIYKKLSSELPSTNFLGYENISGTGQILAIISGPDIIDEAEEGRDVELILDRTPFYAEKGGQVGDSGIIKGERFLADVKETVTLADMCVHRVKVKRGTIKTGDQVYLEVNNERRLAIALNHTATHLLHSALRNILGDHVRQAGSLVAPDRLRFDFTHFAPLTPKEMERIEADVNDKIRNSIKVTTREMGLNEALGGGIRGL